MDSYYHERKETFKNEFGKDADDYLSEFLTYVSIELNRDLYELNTELSGEIADLKIHISELSDIMLGNK